MQPGGGSHIRADLRACPLCVCSPTLPLNRNLRELTSFKFVPCVCVCVCVCVRARQGIHSNRLKLRGSTILKSYHCCKP